ncbi:MULTISPECIES: class I SAM-dependent DNA methyltransferase [Actinosynnema]|uniref:class I SAM-dependent DNA methyltransferase n=1 Tax=Actinosynnema TaxID=40566 RepID=UPI0020A27E69|nr:class I SAM-dependent DNA methyltransferase [Actinosynnema pretiosum]MCP2092757.1 hypothetical protein [Actinosynnema pretiosum]
MLIPDGESSQPLIDTFLKASSDNAVGVSGELRDGLQRSVEIIANEVLARLDQAGVEPVLLEGPRMPIAKELTRESLRYLYRVLFLLYAEARPELGILPADDSSYEAGYSVARLRALVERDEQLAEEEAKQGFHLFESLDLLFRKVNDGHRPQGSEPEDLSAGAGGEDEHAASEQLLGEDRGLRFEPLRSELFEPKAIRLIGRGVDDPDEEGRKLDLRLRNEALHEVLRLLTMKKGARSGDRGGFISYRNLGINQLGAVYEGLMSYTGIIADEELCEVARGGDPAQGSWLVPAHRQQDYPESTLVTYDEHDARKGHRGPKRYPRGTFVYRLAGRDRETSASYYTPESLTEVTVELALKHLLDQERDADGNTIKTRAAELLKYRICEPALGSGAFLNEAIDQVAEEYLRRRQEELGTSVPTADALTEKQKVKAYVALHNAYGVDLNETGVELAEVSLWLNTMHPGMRAPWFGLHLRRGNSLIGGRRAVYSGEDVASPEKAWLKAKGGLGPTPLPFLKDGEQQELPQDAVHQFLLPSPGWAAITGASEAKALVGDEVAQLVTWRRGVLQRPKRSTAHLNQKTGEPKMEKGKPKVETQSQFTRLRDAARRVEFLWSLVVKRMEISEQAIARRIDVWGADPAEPEYGFLRRPEHAVPKEQVLEDLFNAIDTPYWRLKTVMDAWCALWFWPVDKAALLDGTDEVYEEAVTVDTATVTALLGETPVVAEQVMSRIEQHYVLFNAGPEQMSLADLDTEDRVIKPKNPPKAKAKAPSLRDVIPLKDLDDWLDFLEAMLGTHDVAEDELISQFNNLDELKGFENDLPKFMGMDQGNPEQRFPWLHVVRDVAKRQGFLHWELEFALIFTQGGGFDLQVGNPPWVRPQWNEAAVLAEHEPWFGLEDKASASVKERRRAKLLQDPRTLQYFLDELTNTSGQLSLFGSPQVYPLLVGTRANLYRAFMAQVWAHSSRKGSSGLVHPDTHFTGDREGGLRRAAYFRLRVHGDFFNPGHRFFQKPVGESSHFGVHIYGNVQKISFWHLSWLVSVEAFRKSFDHDGFGDLPAIRRNGGEFDERPHKSRAVLVDLNQLSTWRHLLDGEGGAIEQARLLFPVSVAEASAIGALAGYPLRLGSLAPQISSGYNETNAKKGNLIDYNRQEVAVGHEYRPERWRRVILKGTQLSVATSVFKRHDANSNDPYGVDLVSLAADFIPGTEYVRVEGRTREYLAAQDRWVDHRALACLRADEKAIVRARSHVASVEGVEESEVDPDKIDALLAARARRRYATFYRLAWRCMIAPDTERSLYAALIPPGVTHIDNVNSLAGISLESTVLTAGFWASLPVDYLLRVTGRSHLRGSSARAMPAPAPGHPLAASLLLRTLRLNCLTDAYAKLWAELHDPTWQGTEHWARDWPGLQPLHDITPTWQLDTPLRTERARRSALVEIDALVAVWLGMSADALIAAYRGRFPVLQKYEAVTWFDADGWKLAGNARTIGQRQSKETWNQFQAYLEAPDTTPVPDGYTAPFHKADRETEMREAHAVFQARLDAAVARGEWDPVKQEVPQP